MPLPFTGLSVLDRAQTRAGDSEAATLRRGVGRAQRAEQHGDPRLWGAEHPGGPGVAGPAPAGLAAAIAPRTPSIRGGPGGIMLPNHRPLVVAEQAATLAALSGGRFDLGVGRSLGFTRPVRTALGAGKEDAARFEEDMMELLDFLAGEASVTARPRDGGRTPVFVLATGQGVDIAARAGLGVVLGGPGLFREEDPALRRYREAFRPSPWWDAPHVSVSLNVAVAPTTAQARDLLLPEARALAVSRTDGYFPPLEGPDRRQLTSRPEARVENALATAVSGAQAEGAGGVGELHARTGADELLVSGGAGGPEAQSRSDALPADLAAP
ncbi:hypothetical protein AC792_02170 [Arthrobacter sp. RIT-PI-e]|uniref:MsnO8 family LLM class oxidoreductase n=1 Tax=Arthrobacter sp. RIT-PI-e TaxID=1681197 RepID=UPI000675E663|nr:MsnO8 family LLM class oxidoreductase [Arthrobacter sp. RIT-PI-e]KNC20108.1 hypothetical protein AC792_02170 [Arthrobacter sp. RIT-PI-e]